MLTVDACNQELAFVINPPRTEYPVKAGIELRTDFFPPRHNFRCYFTGLNTNNTITGFGSVTGAGPGAVIYNSD
jgi:hypothetical protein